VTINRMKRRWKQLCGRLQYCQIDRRINREFRRLYIDMKRSKAKEAKP
jgi:uncharacterized protein YecT (DUF1311 family)